MAIIIISGIIGVLALGVILYMIWKKIPQIRVLKVDTIAEEKQAKVRDRILMARINRGMKKVQKFLQKLFAPIGKRIKKFVSKKYQHILELEKKGEGQIKGKSGEKKKSSAEVKLILDKAMKLFKNEKYAEAEKIFIEIISYDLHNIVAYRGLAKLYFQQKELEQAEQTYLYLIKLDLKYSKKKSELVEDYLDLAAVYQLMEKYSKMMGVLEKAVDLASKNPKVLDLSIQGALALKNKSLAWDMCKRLEEVNPDNQKLREYSEQVKEI